MGVSRAELYTAIRRDKRLDPEVSQRTLGEKYGLDRRDAAGGPGHAAQAEAHRPQIRPRSTWSTSWPRPRMRRSSRGPSPAMGASISSALDEFGYLDLDKAGAKLLFQIFTEREERRAIAIASNAPFSEWKRTFTDPRLCTSSRPAPSPTGSPRPSAGGAANDSYLDPRQGCVHQSPFEAAGDRSMGESGP